MCLCPIVIPCLIFCDDVIFLLCDGCRLYVWFVLDCWVDPIGFAHWLTLVADSDRFDSVCSSCWASLSFYIVVAFISSLAIRDQWSPHDVTSYSQASWVAQIWIWSYLNLSEFGFQVWAVHISLCVCCTVANVCKITLSFQCRIWACNVVTWLHSVFYFLTAWCFTFVCVSLMTHGFCLFALVSGFDRCCSSWIRLNVSALTLDCCR